MCSALALATWARRKAQDCPAKGSVNLFFIHF
jgi:hypothetical protein